MAACLDLVVAGRFGWLGMSGGQPRREGLPAVFVLKAEGFGRKPDMDVRVCTIY